MHHMELTFFLSKKKKNDRFDATHARYLNFHSTKKKKK